MVSHVLCSTCRLAEARRLGRTRGSPYGTVERDIAQCCGCGGWFVRYTRFVDDRARYAQCEHGDTDG